MSTTQASTDQGASIYRTGFPGECDYFPVKGWRPGVFTRQARPLFLSNDMMPLHQALFGALALGSRLDGAEAGGLLFGVIGAAHHWAGLDDPEPTV